MAPKEGLERLAVVSLSGVDENNLDPDHVQALVLFSAAISLKRIADKLDEVTDWRYDNPSIRVREGDK